MANQQDNTEKCPDICKAVLAETFRIHGWTKLATRTSGREQTLRQISNKNVAELETTGEDHPGH